MLLLIFRPFPQPDGLIVTATDQEAPIGPEGDGINPVLMSSQGLELIPTLGLPQLDGIIVTAAGQKATVGAEIDRANKVRMSLSIPSK